MSNKAPLVETDPMELGDKRLNPEESVCREREDLLKVASAKKIYGQAELEDPMRAFGPRLQWTEVISKLHRCNPEIKVKDGIPGNVALYIRKRADEYSDADMMMPDQRPKDEFFLHHKYVTGFPKQPMHEYSTVDIDTSHLPTREHRGWRSVLIALIKSGAITYRSAVKEFGDPSGDLRSGRWFEQLQEYRNR